MSVLPNLPYSVVAPATCAVALTAVAVLVDAEVHPVATAREVAAGAHHALHLVGQHAARATSGLLLAARCTVLPPRRAVA